MKNITIAVPEQVYRAARIRAAEQGTSVSALVSDYLGRLNRGGEFSELGRLQRQVQNEIHAFKAADRLDRDELHDRALR